MKFRIFTYLLLIVALPAFSQCLEEADAPFNFCLSGISIEASTNVNRFSFSYENPVETGNVAFSNNVCYSSQESGVMDFSIPVRSFRGSNPAMRSDFLQLLKADEFPIIMVGIERNVLDCISDDISSEDVDLLISLAGISRAVKADLTILRDSEDRLVMNGITRFQLTDFQLEPPEKALGLIRVKDEVFINFDIVIQNSDSNSNQALY